MPKYNVKVRETRDYEWKISANDAEQAKKLVESGAGLCSCFLTKTDAVVDVEEDDE